MIDFREPIQVHIEVDVEDISGVRYIFDYAARKGDPSLAYFCPKCGEIWARAFASQYDWVSISKPCPSCGGSGSLRNYFHWKDLAHYLTHIPADLARYEFLCFSSNPELWDTPGR